MQKVLSLENRKKQCTPRIRGKETTGPNSFVKPKWQRNFACWDDGIFFREKIIVVWR